MKKALSLILSLVLLFSCGMIAATAETGKIDPALQKSIDISDPNEMFRVYIRLNGYDKTRQGMTDPEYRESIDFLQKFVLPAIFRNVSYVHYLNISYETLDYILVDMLAKDVEEIAANDIVGYIGKSRTSDPNAAIEGGISAELKEIIAESAPDDDIPIVIYFGDTPAQFSDMESFPDRTKAASEYKTYISDRSAYIDSVVLRDMDTETLFDGSTRYRVIRAKAKDISAIALHGLVRNVDYFYEEHYQHNEVFADAYKLNEALWMKLDRNENADEMLPVYIELDDSMYAGATDDEISVPAKRQTNAFRSKLRDLEISYEDTLIELKAFARITDDQPVCYDALTAKVRCRDLLSVAQNEHVTSVSLYDPTAEWHTDHQAYDYFDNHTRYRKRLLSHYSVLTAHMPLLYYDELYSHPYTSDDKDYRFDWALVEANCSCMIAAVIHEEVVGGRRLFAPGYKQQPFTFNIGLYDAEQDRFFDINEVDFNAYPDLYEIWKTFDLGSSAAEEKRGDADGDNDVTILDATKIQRGIAELDPIYGIVAAGADADADGEMTVLDATRIQRFIAQLCDLDGSVYDEYESIAIPA